MALEDDWLEQVLEMTPLVCDNLRTFLASEVQKAPQLPRRIALEIQAELFFFYDTLNGWIYDSLRYDSLHGESPNHGPLSPIADLIARLPSLGTQADVDFFSILHAGDIVLSTPTHPDMRLDELRCEKSRLLLRAIGAMYAQKADFVSNWLECLKWLAPESDKNFVTATCNKMDKEISAVLGVPFEAGRYLVWLALLTSCKRLLVRARELPDFIHAVDAYTQAGRSMMLDLRQS